MDTAMKSSVFRTIIATLLYIVGTPFMLASENNDSIMMSDTTNFGNHYDRRIHRYRTKWNNLIPTQHVIQFA